MINIQSVYGDTSRKKPLVLVVDDVPKNLRLLVSILKKEGKYRVAVATDGENALKMVERMPPDLILLDVMMPDVNGFEVCKQLKATENGKDIPIIFLTAKTGVKDVLNGFQVGGVDYITKPFNGTELLARVDTHIELKQSRENLSYSLQQLQQANKEILNTNKRIESVISQLKASINYADLIQRAIMPHKEDIYSVFKDSFVIYKPRDIVGGDFFWILNSNKRVIVAAIDCTGHGVPGAFVSILGYQLLREIIVIHGIRQADSILNQLHRYINSVFSRENTEIREGMDAAICSLDFQNRTIEFAGARSPLIYIHDNHLELIKGERFPVGGFKLKEKKFFKRQVFPLHENNTFYLFSDGFPDQLGGEHGHRFTLKRFKNLLMDIQHLPMASQEKILESALDEWMGDAYDQIDDILVIGFRV